MRRDSGPRLSCLRRSEVDHHSRVPPRISLRLRAGRRRGDGVRIYYRERVRPGVRQSPYVSLISPAKREDSGAASVRLSTAEALQYGQPLGAPRSSSEAIALLKARGIILKPRTAAYHLWHRHAHGDHMPHPTAHALQRRRANWRPPRPVRYPWRGVRTWRLFPSAISPAVPRHLGRRVPHPEKQTVCSSRPHGRGMHALYARFGGRG